MLRRSNRAFLIAAAVIASTAAIVSPLGVGNAEAAPSVSYVDYSLLDARGQYHPAPSQYGNKIYIAIRLEDGDDVRAKPSCALTVTRQSTGRLVTKATITLGADDAWYGRWTSVKLKPDTYDLALTCKDKISNGVVEQSGSVTVVDAPPETFAGTVTCVDPQRNFRKPVSMIVIDEFNVGYPKLSASTGAGRAYTSKFAFTAYGGGPYTVNVVCDGTVKKPGTTMTGRRDYTVGTYAFQVPYTPGRDGYADFGG